MLVMRCEVAGLLRGRTIDGTVSYRSKYFRECLEMTAGISERSGDLCWPEARREKTRG